MHLALCLLSTLCSLVVGRPLVFGIMVVLDVCVRQFWLPVVKRVEEYSRH